LCGRECEFGASPAEFSSAEAEVFDDQCHFFETAAD
jgi:hypothetical protein